MSGNEPSALVSCMGMHRNQRQRQVAGDIFQGSEKHDKNLVDMNERGLQYVRKTFLTGPIFLS